MARRSFNRTSTQLESTGRIVLFDLVRQVHARDGAETYVNLLYTPQAHQVFSLDFEPAFFGGGICRFHRSLRLSNLRV